MIPAVYYRENPHFPLPPADCRRILIVGAGGFGREALNWAYDTWPKHASLVRGFLSADASILDGHGCPLPVVADPAAFEPQPGDALILAIGTPGVRRRVAEQLVDRGGRFLTLVHPTAIVTSNARIGSGSILCPGAIVSDSATMGRFVLVNYHASLAHDASAGDFAVLSPYATLGGFAKIGDDVFLGLHASVGPRIEIGSRSKVSANSAALASAPADSLIYSVPGRISPLVPPK